MLSTIREFWNDQRGIAMILVSYLVGSWLLMSLICLALIVAVYLLAKRGY